MSDEGNSNPFVDDGAQQQPDVQPQQGDQGLQQQQQEAPPAQPRQEGLTPEALREILKEVRQQQPQQQQQMSEEEVNRLLRVRRADAELAQRLGLQPDVAAHLDGYGQDLVRQAVTYASLQMEALGRRVQQQLEPLLQFQREQAEAKLQDEFLTENPDLKGYVPLLRPVYEQMLREGYKAPTKAQAFKDVAERARQLVKQLPGAQSGTTAATATGGKGRMSTLSGGGQGGAGDRRGGDPGVNPTAKALFG